MDKNELKKKICAAIDAQSERLIGIGKKIWENPEPGYEEYKTSALIQDEFKALDLPYKAGMARTGVRADLDTGKAGPAIAVLGEMDALIMPENPAADPVTHAAHACGHNMQVTAMLGAAMGLSAVPEVKELLSGKIAFIACPAEECRIAEHEGVKYIGGKAELIRQGVFDDIQISFMTHANSRGYGAAQTCNGFIMKKVLFHGLAGHCGRPWVGINALSAARLALDAVDMQRDLFQDDDCVRIHGIFQKAGSVVNIVPEETELEYQIRAMRPEAIREASEMFDRSIRGAAVAFGLKAEIVTYAGYMPLYNEPELLKIHRDNLKIQRPNETFLDAGKSTGSTDMGDVSSIMPAIHPYTGGWAGTGHQSSFHWIDDRETFVDPGKILAMDAVDLLFGDASEGKRIAAIKPKFTKAEYLAYLDSFMSEEKIDGTAR